MRFGLAWLAAAAPLAPELYVDLDLAPADRWGDIMAHQIEQHGWNQTFAPIFSFIRSIVPDSDWAKYDRELAEVAARILGPELTEEVRGIHATAVKLHYSVFVSELLFFQVFYELLMQCTGVLARGAGGGVLHGRNMDIGLTVQNITATVHWQRANRTILSSTQYLGYVGVHTGMRHGGWTVQVNERVVLEPGPVIGYLKASLLRTAADFLKGHKTVGQYLRDALLGAATYEQALPLLEQTPLASPVYVVVGGLKTGTVVTRGRAGVATQGQDTTPFGAFGKMPLGAGVFNLSGPFLVQTNWDPWVTRTQADCAKEMAANPAWKEKLCEEYIHLLYNDSNKCDDICRLYSDGRREAGTALMRDLPAFDPPHLLGALSTAPVKNSITQFTAVMSASTGHYQTWLQQSGDAPDGAPPAGIDPRVLGDLRDLLRELTGLPLGGAVAGLVV